MIWKTAGSSLCFWIEASIPIYIHPQNLSFFFNLPFIQQVKICMILVLFGWFYVSVYNRIGLGSSISLWRTALPFWRVGLPFSAFFFFRKTFEKCWWWVRINEACWWWPQKHISHVLRMCDIPFCMLHLLGNVLNYTPSSNSFVLFEILTFTPSCSFHERCKHNRVVSRALRNERLPHLFIKLSFCNLYDIVG